MRKLYAINFLVLIFVLVGCGKTEEHRINRSVFGFRHGSGNVQSVNEEVVTCSTNLKPSEVASELESKIDSTHSGSICLASGTYPHINIVGDENSSYVTIRPAVGATVTSGGFFLRNFSFLKFEKINFTEGIEAEDSVSFAGSHNLEVLENVFQEPHVGVYLKGGAGAIKKVNIERNYIHNVRLVRETECHAGKGDGQGVTAAFADGVNVQHNTFYQAAWHYIQGGGNTEGMNVEHNLFVGHESCVNAHLNIWQIFAASKNDNFKHNAVIAESTSSPVSVIVMIFENGAGGAVCSEKIENVAIEDNVFINPSTSNIVQIGQITNITVSHNTGVRFTTGWKMSSGCGASTKVTETHNIMVEGQSGGAEKAGFVGFSECSVECLFDFNVSSDTSASAYGGTTHFVTNWTPAWENATQSLIKEIESGNLFPKLPTGYYMPTTTSVKELNAGYEGPNTVGP